LYAIKNMGLVYPRYIEQHRAREGRNSGTRLAVV
jgi:hypothetical protein